VVSGVAIHGDTQWQAIEVELGQIVETHVPRALWGVFHFHAMHLFSDHKSFRGLITTTERFQMLREIAGAIPKYDLPVSYGAVDRRRFAKEPICQLIGRKAPNRIKLAHNVAFGLSVMGLQRWFNRSAADEVGVCVADRNDKTQASLKAVFQMMRHFPLNPPLVTLSNFVDALHFTASRESIGLQLADVAAFFVKRHLMQKADSEEFYKIIEPQLCVAPADALLYKEPG